MNRIAPDVSHMAKGVSHTGSATFNCGDVVATTLLGWPLDCVRDMASFLDIDVTRYDHLNPGHQRMVIGNAFRKMVSDRDKAYDAKTENTDGEVWFNGVADQFRPDFEELESTKRMREKEHKMAERERKKAEREALKAEKAAEREKKRQEKLAAKEAKEAKEAA